MILLEFAAQGVRGVAPAGGRANLRPGYVVVPFEGAALRRLLEALLYPSPKDGDAIPRAAAGKSAAPVRAGLTLAGDDRVTYRVVRDFAAGAQLHRFDQEKRAFVLVAQELPEIAAYLQKAAGVPPVSKLGALLSISAAELPSRQGGAASSLPGVEPRERTALSPEQARKRIGQLREELEKARVAEKVQYQLDGLQSKLFKLEEALKGGAKVREGLERAEAARAELEEVARVAASLGDPVARLTAYERTAARRDEAASKAAKEREALDGTEAAGPPLPFWRDPRFWGGIGGGVALGTIAAVAASASSELRYLSVPAIAAYGVAAWFAWGWIGQVEGWDRVARRRRVLDDWERKVSDQFDRDGAEVHAAMKALNLQRASELKEQVARLQDADQVVAEWRRRLVDWETSPEASGAQSEKAALEEQARALEARLGVEAGGFVRDVRSVEQELQRAEADAAAPAHAAPEPAAPRPPPRPAGDPLRMVLEAAAKELGGSPSAAARTVAQKASQHLVALSFQRLGAIQPDDRGNLSVQTGGRPVAAGTLAAVDKDLVWLALKLAFVERALAEGKTVAIVDDAFAGLAEGARRLAARLLKAISRPGQLVHATSDPAFREAADHVA